MTLEEKIRQFREYKRLAEEAEALADSIADELKAAMAEAGQDKMTVGEYKLSYTACTRKDIDKKRLEVEAPTVYAAFLKETTYRRLQVA